MRQNGDMNAYTAIAAENEILIFSKVWGMVFME
jgi:hypothetical protein